MSGFVKLFGSIVTSTIWQEDPETKVVWITLLVLADAEGFVNATIPGLANIAKISIEKTREAIEKLESPDPDSRTIDFGGRRIAKVDGGWFILNYLKYRKVRDPLDRKEYMRKYMQEYRKQNVNNVNKQNVNDVNGVNNVNHGKPKLAQAEEEEDSISTSPKETRVDEQSQVEDQKSGSEVAATSSDDELFERFWATYPKKIAKKKCRQIWARLKISAELTEQIVNSVKAYGLTSQWQEANGKYIPYPERFLSKARWQDEIPNDDDGSDMYKTLGTRKATNEDIERLKAKGIL